MFLYKEPVVEIQPVIVQPIEIQPVEEVVEVVPEVAPVEVFTITTPVIAQPLSNVEYLEATSALFEFKVEGHHLNFDWFKGREELVNPFRYKMSYDEASGMVRLFIGTVLADDAGEYICRVYNTAGEVQTSARLILIGKLFYCENKN